MPVSQFVPTDRAEQIIAAGRAILGAIALLAIWIDPTEPSHHAEEVYGLLAVYLGWALLAWLGVTRVTVVGRRFGLLTHGVDLIVFLSLQYLTAAVSSPFFVYFLFALVAATIRWQVRGVLWTGAAVLVGFFALASWSLPIAGEGEDFDVTRFIVRAVYLMVITALLAYLGAYEQRLREERSRLTAWPQQMSSEPDPSRMLEHVARVLEAPRVVMLWERLDEPWLFVSTWANGESQSSRLPPNGLPEPVRGDLRGTPFLCADLQAPRPRVLYRRDGQFGHLDGDPIEPAVRTRLDIRQVLAAPLSAQTVTGWLLAVDKVRMTSDDIVLAELAARAISAQLDRASLLRSLEEDAATRERERLADDLHDGLLQSLTGIDLRLQQLRERHPALGPEIDGIQATLAAEHSELRHFVRAAPGEPGAVAAFDLDGQLRALPERLRHEVEVAVNAGPGLENVPAGMGRQIYMMVREATFNAVKHGAASSVRVSAQANREAVSVLIANDGRPFSFTGRYADEELEQLSIGPRSLRRRVRELGGRVQLESGEDGVRLEIALPLAPAAHAH